MSEKLFKFDKGDIPNARAKLSALCQNSESFRMSIPPNWDDTDMVFSRVINQCENLQKQNEILRDACDFYEKGCRHLARAAFEKLKDLE